MLGSLDRLAALPGATRIFCGHEYTEANLRFAMAVEPANSAIMDYVKRAAGERAAGRPTLPSTIELEKRVNPFLRCRHEDVKSCGRAPGGQAAVHAGGGVCRDSQLEGCVPMIDARLRILAPLLAAALAAAGCATTPAPAPARIAGRAGRQRAGRGRVPRRGGRAGSAAGGTRGRGAAGRAARAGGRATATSSSAFAASSRCRRSTTRASTARSSGCSGIPTTLRASSGAPSATCTTS